MPRAFIAFVLALLAAACSSELMQGTIAPALISLSDPQAGVAAQQAFQRRQAEAEANRFEDANKREFQAAFAFFNKVWEETGNPFEARQRTRAKYFQLFMNDPKSSRTIDQWTALAWFADGGEIAGAVCYMKGFAFGTAHHDQCVYEVKMEAGTSFSATATPPPASQAQRPREKWSQPQVIIGPVEQRGKVYDPSECVGPVIMGRCHGTILPNKAYHPTCYGTWLNGECTGPMF